MSAVTVKQVEALAALVKRGIVTGVKAGIGSNGYPAGPDMLVLGDQQSAWWIAPDGRVTEAS